MWSVMKSGKARSVSPEVSGVSHIHVQNLLTKVLSLHFRLGQNCVAIVTEYIISCELICIM